MIFVIMGKSATGKDTIFAKLARKRELKLKKFIPYTTRPLRAGEVDGKQYHFVDELTLEIFIESGRVVERRMYNTVHGVWHYFTVDDHKDIRRMDKKYIMIATLEAYNKIREYYGSECVVPIYIEVDDCERIKRALKREFKQENPSPAEVCRRFLADEKDFSDELLSKAGITKSYVNDNIKECMERICETIKKY